MKLVASVVIVAALAGAAVVPAAAVVATWPVSAPPADCLAGMWEYDHYTDAALFYDYGLVDVDLTGVIAEFGDGYFRFTTGDASTIDGLLLEMAGGSSTEDGPEPLELDAAGALVTEGGRVRLLPTRLSVSVGVPAVFGQEYAQVLLPTAALGVDCSGDQATLTTPKGSTLSLTRRADLRPTPPQQTPTPPPRDPALDCLAGIWIETDRAIPAADTSVTERGARWWFGDGLFGFDYPWYVAGTVHGVDARGTLGGAYDQGPYLEDRSSITLDGGWGEGGSIAFFDASGAALEGDFAQFRNDDHFAVECAGDRATLTSDGGTTIALQRDTTGFGPYVDDYYGPRGAINVVDSTDDTDLATGCAHGQPVPEQIPDGLWRGNITGFDGATVADSTELRFDLVCVYGGEAQEEQLGLWQSDHPSETPTTAPDGLVVNDNPRERSVPLADGFVLMAAEWADAFTFDDATEEFVLGRACVVPDGAQPLDSTDQAGVTSSWVQILDGEAQWAVELCTPTS